MAEIITKQNLSSSEGSRGGWWSLERGGSLWCMCGGWVRTCNKQSVHAWWRLGGLEHFGDVLLRQRGLSSALPLGVLLLPPLEVLGGGREREREKEGEGGGGGGEDNRIIEREGGGEGGCGKGIDGKRENGHEKRGEGGGMGGMKVKDTEGTVQCGSEEKGE